MPRPLRMFLLLLAAASCGDALRLPSTPVPPIDDVLPVITDFAPRGVFSEEYIELEGTGFDPRPQNNIVLFSGGFTTTPESADSDGTRLRVRVPYNAETGPIFVRTPVGTSAAADAPFTNLGYGHPVLGTGVAELRFRHRPVGLVNIEARILVASTLFDAVLDDSGRFKWVTGRPAALVRLPGEHGLLSTHDENGGRLMVIDASTTDVLATSAPAPRTELFLLPASGPGPTFAHTIGLDANGRAFLSHWKREGATLLPTSPPVALGLAAIHGATVRDDVILVVGTRLVDGVAKRVLARVSLDGEVTVRWQADAEAVPAGPVALVELAAGPSAILGLADGDLATLALDAGPLRRSRMISFAPAHAVVPTLQPGHVLVTKPRDGAIYDYDMETGEFVWSAQLRGEPTEIDVSVALGEIAVANAEDNDIDVLSLADGRWLGRSSLSLALGSADGGPGGIVGPYSYDPGLVTDDGLSRPQVMHLLARTAPLVIEIDANELGMIGQHVLDASASPPLRLAVTPDLRTLVVHRAELGLVADPVEKIVARHLPSEPTAVAFTRDGSVLVASTGSVDRYSWRDGMLEKTATLAIPDGAVVTGLVSHRTRRPGRDDLGDGGRDTLLVTWRTASGPGGAFFDPAALQGPVVTGTAIRLPAGASDQTGLADLAEGPVIVFARATNPDDTPRGPTLVRPGYLRGESGIDLLPGFTTIPSVMGQTPDGRFALWVTDGSGEFVVRVLQYGNDFGFYPWNGYRLAAAPAGPSTDPSGEWLYIPIPKLDLLSVVQ